MCLIKLSDEVGYSPKFLRSQRVYPPDVMYRRRGIVLEIIHGQAARILWEDGQIVTEELDIVAPVERLTEPERTCVQEY